MPTFSYNQSRLKKLLEEFFNNHYVPSDFVEEEHERLFRSQKFRELIETTPFTEFEFFEIIKLAWSTNIWSNKEWLAKNILQQNSLEKLSKYFKLLLQNDIPIHKRYKLFNENIKGLGAAFTTEILCHLEPQNAAIWNTKSATLIRFLDTKGLNTTKHINYSSFSAKDYNKFNTFMKTLLKDINHFLKLKNLQSIKDLLELDYLVWKLYNLIPDDYKKSKKGRKEQGRVDKNTKTVQKSKATYAKSYHNELRDKIAQIGQWLGFDTEIEKTISSGSRVDVVWEAKIANLGKVKYIFEVQHKGSIDSLIVNLQKAKNKMPEVQKLIIVTNKEQIQKIKEYIADMDERFRKAVRFWEDTSVEQAHRNLEELIDIIKNLGLVE